MIKRTINLLTACCALLPFLFTGCSSGTGTEYYSMDDYDKIEKYDVHVHINTFNPYFINYAKKENLKLLSLNVEVPGYPPIEMQQKYLLAHTKNFPGWVHYATTFSLKNWKDSNWQAESIDYLRKSFDSGALGVKVWKAIGMELRGSDNKFVMIDNPRFDTIIDFIAAQHKTLVGHIGEPRNCWLPIKDMTVNNDKNYFKEHPEYHMFLHPEYPSYEDQVNARDHMLEKHPGLMFDGAHLGSLEWSVDELAKRLDKFPDMAVDMAARVCHLQYQASTDYKKVYDFMIKYQDRLLYATDTEIDDSMDSTATLKAIHDQHFNDWKFFTSDETMEVPEVNGKFQGLHLPKVVIDKIYRKNAEKWFPGLTKN